ncbi:multidrug effflux MFS transporter [bacterium]|nr:multidrug effflux MFS transporter [bacterium]
MTAPPRTRVVRPGELIFFVSGVIALTALSIDLMLPAFGEIRASFDLAPDSNATAAIVTSFMIGLSIAQIGYGPLADRFGRKPVLYLGMIIYAIGAAGAALAPTFGFLLASRVLWGIGSAGPRVIAISIIRDTYSGDRMARAMSYIMAVFIMVPVVAPSIGAAITSFSGWRMVFWFCVAYVAFVALWSIRIPETLNPDSVVPLKVADFLRSMRFILGNRTTVGNTAAMTVLFGILVSYLATSELIFDEVFDRGDQFPIIFGGLAAVMGVAMLANARLVDRLGTGRIVTWVLRSYIGVGTVMVALALASDGRPGFWPFAVLMSVLLSLYAVLVPNMNTLAMDPMAPVAGTASALIGTAQTGIGAILGSIIDSFYDGTITPFAIAILISAIVAVALRRWALTDPS